MPEYDVFISYKSEDLAFAEELHRRLVEEGVSVWFDKARLGEVCRWHEEIEAGCEASRVILPVLTPRWQTSDWCKYENYGGEAVIPLLFEDIPHDGPPRTLDQAMRDVAPQPLHEWQAVDMRGRIEAVWQDLFGRIRRQRAQPAPEKTPRLVRLPFSANPNFVGRDGAPGHVAVVPPHHRLPGTVDDRGRAGRERDRPQGRPRVAKENRESCPTSSYIRDMLQVPAATQSRGLIAWHTYAQESDPPPPIPTTAQGVGAPHWYGQSTKEME